MGEQELVVRCRELAKDFLIDYGIEAGLKKKFANQPAQAEALIEEYKKYYKLIFTVYIQPTA